MTIFSAWSPIWIISKTEARPIFTEEKHQSQGNIWAVYKRKTNQMGLQAFYCWHLTVMFNVLIKELDWLITQ